MRFDALKYEYRSKRNVIYGTRGMVCTSQPQAAQAGLDIIKAGGNAVDAAIATAACMTVMEPTSNGLGSDAFALVWMKDQLYGLNASGRAPVSLSAEKLRALGYTEMPRRGWIPVMVPGAPSAWAELSKRFGRLPLETVLEKAADYAEHGYPVSPNTAYLWKVSYDLFSDVKDQPEFKPWFDCFGSLGHAPEPGEIWKNPEMAETIRLIGKTGAEAYYRGEIAEKIDAFSRATGGYLRKEDLAAYHPDWVTPITVNYHGYDVWEIPPNGAGLTALMALNIMDGYHFTNRNDAEMVHVQLEAMKLAYMDAKQYITDADHMRMSVQALLSKKYADKRRELITDRAELPRFGDPEGSGTIYLCTADGEGNMVSYIQSNFNGFGSGIVVPGTGISLQNRGFGFSLDEEAENCLRPGKKTYHTIIPGFLSKDGQAIGPFGVMGGFMQPQGHVQVVMNTVDFHMNPQDALNAPRWQWMEGKTIAVEKEFPTHIVEELIRKGHKIQIPAMNTSFGRGQIIWRNEDGVLCGATEPRADGTVAVW